MVTITPETPGHVFLSYASTDRERALRLADRLEAQGVRVWIDRSSIAGGSSWTAEIVRGIRNCAALLVLCSPASVASANVQRELNLGVEYDRPLIPLLLAPTEFPDEVQYALAGRQRIELLDQEEIVWLPQLLQGLERLGISTRPASARAVVLEPDEAAADGVHGNLPFSLTTFLGRERELADLAQLIASNRLVTLTGPGGTGKTRLALQVASSEAAAFPDYVFFVDLAPLQDPTLVPSAVAQVLGVRPNPDLPVRDGILRFVRHQRSLLVLDNFEHLLAASEFAVALLQAGPGLTLLVTSQAPLRVSGEREYPVAPLPLPSGRPSNAAAVADNPAVALFVLRAQAVRPDFGLTTENAPSIAAICTRLDGLPLAIELAAARVRALPPASLLTRLEQRLPLLTGGARDVPARQQTLRGAITWSYDLLAPAEQLLFRRLGVFAGGCTLELAEAVCNGDGDLGIDVLDSVSSLVEKSLLREAEGLAGEPRYRMLETIREFALGELQRSGEADTLRQQLAVQVLQLARHAAAANNWARLDVELDNARAVLGWCVERAELAVGVRLFWALQGYLFLRGYGNEQQEWRQRLLALPDAALPSISRARLLAVPLEEISSIADQERAAADLEEAIGLSRELGDTRCLAHALGRLAFALLRQGAFDAAVQPAEEALRISLAAGDTRQTADMHVYLIQAAVGRGDIATADSLLAANRELEAASRSGAGLISEAWLAEAHGDYVGARVFLEEAVREAGAAFGEQSPLKLIRLASLARVMQHQGDMRAAVATCGESLTVQYSVGPTRFLPRILEVLAWAAERCGLSDASASLLAIANGQSQRFAAELFDSHEEQQAAAERVRGTVGEVAFAEAWAAGQALSAEESIEFGLNVVPQLQELLAASPGDAAPTV